MCRLFAHLSQTDLSLFDRVVGACASFDLQKVPCIGDVYAFGFSFYIITIYFIMLIT